jgi:2-amino-4-hydroxy-6-hydroxymethyldihydropteridine diphosphokinase
VSAHRAYVGIGANAGDPTSNVERALGALAELGIVTRRSSLYRTQPWGKRDQPPFVNAVALLETTYEPHALLAALKDIEVRLGRSVGERWGPRSIDLDLLTYDDLMFDEPGLRVPHPFMRERAFVLVPLAEIDRSYESLRDALSDSALQGVERLVNPAS